jgi:hypothetical protein
MVSLWRLCGSEQMHEPHMRWRGATRISINPRAIATFNKSGNMYLN